MKYRFELVLLLGLLFCVMLLGRTGRAEEAEKQDFIIDAQLFPFSADDMTYDVQVTVSNQGEDWEGNARVRIMQDYAIPKCVFDTLISLPQGSTKQFVVRMPVESVKNMEGTVIVSLLDRESNVAAEKEFKRLLIEQADTLVMGILSDSYSALTYLDMAGEKLYYGGNDLPVKLQELTPDNLLSSLDSLVFLVIDNYNTSVLTQEMLSAIRKWVFNGGSLILGTGKRAEDVLSGLDYLGITCIQVNEPTGNTGLSQLSQAELMDTTERYDVFADGHIITSWGDGMVEIVPYALSELGSQKQVIYEREQYVRELLKNVNGYAMIRYNDIYSKGYFGDYFSVSGLFDFFGTGRGRLDFGALKWIVAMYVIFVGPVLYLLLRHLNKRDSYWIAVPVTALAGILLVYLAGRGFEVANTRVYSVTIENLSDQDFDEDAWTYMHCYDAGHKEWKLQLAERYAYIGPVLIDSYTSNDYYYHVSKEGDSISFGVNPDIGFADGYFRAGTSQKMGTGNITSDLSYDEQLGLMGTVINGTNQDFEYFVVIMDDFWYIYGNLPAGETYSLESLDDVECKMGWFSSKNYNTLYDYEYEFFDGKEKKDIDILAALGIGISVVRTMNKSGETVIIGVTEDWDKTVDDNCSETSYGCLYSVQ